MSFKGSCTSYPKTESVSYDWDFGSGSGIADSAQQAPSVTFKNAGTYTVKLSCTDAQGTGSDSISVTVASPSSGGGAPGLPTLMGLAALTAARRFRRR